MKLRVELRIDGSLKSDEILTGVVTAVLDACAPGELESFYSHTFDIEQFGSSALEVCRSTGEVQQKFGRITEALGWNQGRITADVWNLGRITTELHFGRNDKIKFTLWVVLWSNSDRITAGVTGRISVELRWDQSRMISRILSNMVELRSNCGRLRLELPVELRLNYGQIGEYSYERIAVELRVKLRQRDRVAEVMDWRSIGPGPRGAASPRCRFLLICAQLH